MDRRIGLGKQPQNFAFSLKRKTCRDVPPASRVIGPEVRVRLRSAEEDGMITSARLAGFAFCIAALIPTAGWAGPAADYPTEAVVDYVLGCMQSNGQTRQALERCSCSIDVIASIIPYERYETAETFRRMALTTGEASSLFRETAPARAAGSDLRRAQAEADIRCF